MDPSKPPATPGPEPIPAEIGPGRRPLAKVRHDLRTLVNHIVGYSQMLLEEAPGRVPEGFLLDLGRIHNGGQQLLDLVNQHFSGNAFSSGTPDLHRLCHDLRTPVNHVVGYSELLLDQCAESGWDDLRTDLAKINRAAKTWLELMESQLFGETGRAMASATGARYSETAIFTRLHQAFAEPPAESPTTELPAQGRLLLADDDESNRGLLKRRLEKLGYEVTVCGDGRQALALASGGSFDLVLLDVLMPGLDGREVLARLKADPALHHLPVIMLSALDEVQGIVRCIELGAEDYISKPFNPVFLRARIGAALEKKRFRDREASYLCQIQQEKKRSEDLLRIILPPDVADELKLTSVVRPRRFESVGVLFCDLVGFTAYCDRHPPEEILEQLQLVVETFETLAATHGLEKIKTVGDAFLATAGLRSPLPNPALSCARCAGAMIAAASQLPPHWRVRVGLHVGPVIAGIVGRKKYQYDVWGDTVNLAARLQEAAQPGSICVSAQTWRLLEGHCPGTPLGFVDIKGKGRLELFRITP